MSRRPKRQQARPQGEEGTLKGNVRIAGACLIVLGGFAVASFLPSGRGSATQVLEGTERTPVPARPVADGPLDAVRLDSMLAVADRIRPLSSLLAWHRDELVVERYYGGMRADQTTNLKSVSKTLLSPLVGIALRDSLIASEDVPLRSVLPDLYARLDASSFDDARKDEILLRHLLDMSSGLESVSFGNYGGWVASSDWGWDQLKRPVECEPGRCYEYSTGSTHLLGIALAEVSGRDLRRFAQDELFGPLGISLPSWDRSPEGYYLGGNNMALRPIDLLKLGVLFLDDGQHEGRQIVPREWIEESWRPRFRSPWNGMGYGHLWWVSDWGDEEVFSAWGYGGQFLVIVPRLDLVVVATSSLARTERGHNRRMRRFFDEYVVPAFQSVETTTRSSEGS